MVESSGGGSGGGSGGWLSSICELIDCNAIKFHFPAFVWTWVDVPCGVIWCKERVCRSCFRKCHDLCVAWSTRWCQWCYPCIRSVSWRGVKWGTCCDNVPCGLDCTRTIPISCPYFFDCGRCGDFYVDYPCGVKYCPTLLPTGIEWRLTNICQLLGIERFVAPIRNFCFCVADALDFVSLLTDYEGGSTDLRARVASRAAGLVDCIVDITNPNTNEEQVRSRVTSKGAIIWGPEIDIKLYAELAINVGACVFGNCDLILSMFVKLFGDSVDMFGSGLADEVEEKFMTEVVDPLKAPFNIDWGALVDQLEAAIAQCWKDAQESSQRLLDEFIKPIRSAADQIKNVGRLVTDLEGQVRGVVAAIRAGAEALGIASFEELILKVLQDGELPPFFEAGKFLIEGGGVVELVNDVEDVIDKLSDLGPTVRAAINLIDDVDRYEDIIDDLEDKCLNRNDRLATLRRSISDIRSRFKAAVNVGDNVQRFAERLADFPIEAGAATYRKYFDITFSCARALPGLSPPLSSDADHRVRLSRQTLRSSGVRHSRC